MPQNPPSTAWTNTTRYTSKRPPKTFREYRRSGPPSQIYLMSHSQELSPPNLPIQPLNPPHPAPQPSPPICSSFQYITMPICPLFRCQDVFGMKCVKMVIYSVWGGIPWDVFEKNCTKMVILSVEFWIPWHVIGINLAKIVILSERVGIPWDVFGKNCIKWWSYL